MSNTWPKMRLGEVLRRSEETIQVQPDISYRQITVKLWGKGVVLRGILSGAEIAAPRQMVARRGQFILSRIDARNGALGIVPDELDEAIVSNDFPVFEVAADRLLSAYLGWMCKTESFVEECKRASEGTTNRVRLQEKSFLAREIPLPPLTEQWRIVARIDALATQLKEIRTLRAQQETELSQMLLAAFLRIVRDVPRHAMGEIAPLVRRPVNVDALESYPELGIRSFGKGTFHKPALTGLEIGSKRVFRIDPGDLLFSNVFAWEGAIAVAGTHDTGRIGSHRYITCVPVSGVATAQFLKFYFLTQEGLSLIGAASPGGAGRNRTLGLNALEKIAVPTPPIEVQRKFDALQAEVDALKRVHAESATDLDALLPAILDRAFKGEL